MVYIAESQTCLSIWLKGKVVIESFHGSLCHIGICIKSFCASKLQIGYHIIIVNCVTETSPWTSGGLVLYLTQL